MRIKLILLGGLLGVLMLVGMSMNLRAQGTIGNVTGWAWGGTTDNAVGTVPTGCATHTPQPNCDPTLSNASGFGWVSLSNTTGGGSASYGLTVPQGDGDVHGYAWSSNLGWINFDPAGPYPNCAGCPMTNVQRVNNKFVGWARVVSIPTAGTNAGGFEGWIKFSPTYTGSVGGTSYTGVEISPQGGGSTGETIRGYAWSNEFGWIVFGGLTSGNPTINYGGTTVTPPTPPGPPPPPGPGPTPPPSTTSLFCAPATQTVLRNQPANFTASGGTATTYAWNAPSSTHLTGVGASFTTTYTATGTYQVTVTSGGANALCRVTVPVFIEVPP